MIYSVALHSRVVFPLCCQVSTTNNFLVKNGSPCPFSIISAGASSGLYLCRSYACCHSLWSLSVHHSYSAWKTLGNHPSLLAFTILPPLLCVIFPNDHLNFSDNITFFYLYFTYFGHLHYSTNILSTNIEYQSKGNLKITPVITLFPLIKSVSVP